jgi:DNA-directed RNA polymerase specialized sigma24 family protein
MCRLPGNHHDAEDVLQEASLKAYRAIAEFQGNSRFYTWLVRIAVKRRWQLHPSRNRELG